MRATEAQARAMWTRFRAENVGATIHVAALGGDRTLCGLARVRHGPVVAIAILTVREYPSVFEDSAMCPSCTKRLADPLAGKVPERDAMARRLA